MLQAVFLLFLMLNIYPNFDYSTTEKLVKIIENGYLKVNFRADTGF